MSAIDWTIIGLYLIWIVWDGIRLSRDTGKLEGYFLASKSLPWWAVGLSVMATLSICHPSAGCFCSKK